jgi:hypothetical protein
MTLIADPTSYDRQQRDIFAGLVHYNADGLQPIGNRL